MNPAERAIAAAQEAQMWLDTHKGTHSARKRDVKALQDAVRELVEEREATAAARTTSEEIFAAAEAIRRRVTWPSMHWPQIRGVENFDVSVALARAALDASRVKQDLPREYVDNKGLTL